jgi:cold shock CspA family protein
VSKRHGSSCVDPKQKGNTKMNSQSLKVQNQRKGIVTRFVAHRNFGFIVSRDETGVVQTYFFHISNMRFCEPEIPSTGDLASFDVYHEPAKPGKYRLADNVSIFKNPEPVVTGLSVLSGEPSSQKGDAGGAL